MKAKYIECHEGYSNEGFEIGSIYDYRIDRDGDFNLINEYGKENVFFKHEIELIIETDLHYNNDKGSLYLFAEQHELNAWEFDIIKRITRCRKKGQFIEDLEKTKRVIDLYLKEYDSKTIG